MTIGTTPRRPPPPIPVTIITGFLGAGKTTLLNRLLQDAALARTVVLINEFGEIGLDHLFVEKIDGDMIMLSSGCLCCTIRGELIDALENLLRRLDNGRIAPFERVVIETTGLADPAPVLHTIMSHPYLVLRFRLDGVVTVVDAVNGEATLASHQESVRQAAVADRIVLSKTDLVEPMGAEASTQRLREKLATLNPTARIVERPENFDAAHLFDAGLYNPATKSPDVTRWLNAEAFSHSPHDHAHHHDHGAHDVNRHGEAIRAFCLTSDVPLRPSSCDLFLEILRNAHGPALLRVKGVVALADDPRRPLVIHGVQHIFHPPVRLEAWPDGDHRTRIVFIVKDLQPDFLQGLYDAFAGKPAIDRPDAQAIAANPLKPSTGGLLG